MAKTKEAEEVKEATGKIKTVIWIDLDVYEALMNAKTKYSRTVGRAVKQSAFIEERVFKPYLKAGGFLK